MTNSITYNSFQVREYFDYVPVVSTITNIVDLYRKCVMDSGEQTAPINRYYTHLQQKSYARCIALLIPIVGNLIVALYDFYNYMHPQMHPNSSNTSASTSISTNTSSSELAPLSPEVQEALLTLKQVSK